MLNILAVTSPGDGHVNPMLAIVATLVLRGHRVTWYSGRAYRDRVERVGATFLPMTAGYDYGGLNREQAFPDNAKLRGVAGMVAGFRDAFLDTAPGYLRDLTDFVDATPVDVMITDETSFAAGLLGELRGIPVVWVSTSIYILSSRDTAPLGLGLAPSASAVGRLRNRVLGEVANRVVLRELRRAGSLLRERVGLTALPRGAFENIVDHPRLYLMGTVPSFEYPRSDLLPQVEFVGSVTTPGPADYDTPSWWGELTGIRPVVHVTQGTIADDASHLLVPAIRALAGLDVLVVVTTGVPPEQLDLGPRPGNVVVERFVPHALLLPHVDVMVTNGGYGGVNTALSHGVPLVIAAATEEKHEVAAHVAWSGAGLRVRRSGRFEPRLRRAVRRVLDEESFRRRAHALRAEFARLSGPERAADRVEELDVAARGSRDELSRGGG